MFLMNESNKYSCNVVVILIKTDCEKIDVNELLLIAQSDTTIQNENKEKLRDTLLSRLPSLSNLNIDNIKGTPESFVVEFSANLKNRQDVSLILEEYGIITKEELRIAKTV